MKTLIFLLPLLLAVSSSAKHWGYENTGHTYGPENWAHHSQDCGMHRQSPVLLVCKRRRHTGPVRFYMKGGATEGKATNNGHSLVFSISTSSSRPLRMAGGPLAREFVVEQFHFHWGSKSSVRHGKGSEHRLRRRRTIAELHIVTYNGKYGSFKEAVTKRDGLAVFGVLLEERERLRSAVHIGKVDLRKLIKHGSSVQIPASSNLAGGLVNALKMTGVTQHYYMYAGSLTTPPCTENVQWIVSTTLSSLPKGMLAVLQEFKDEDNAPLVDNFRPLQRQNVADISCS